MHQNEKRITKNLPWITLKVNWHLELTQTEWEENLDPQWQKSEDTEKKLLGSSTYLASIRPYMASFSALSAPTKIGTIFTGYLHKYHYTKKSQLQQTISTEDNTILCKYYPSNTLARYGKCISMLCSASSTSRSIISNFPVALSSSTTDGRKKQTNTNVVSLPPNK